MQQLREKYFKLLAHFTNLCDAQKVMAHDVTQIVYFSSPAPSSPYSSSKRKRSTEETGSLKYTKKNATSSVNDKISAAGLQTDAADSASSITLSALLLIAREKGAFITENYQLILGWKRKTKEKAKHVINKMVELMDEDEEQALFLDPPIQYHFLICHSCNII